MNTTRSSKGKSRQIRKRKSPKQSRSKDTVENLLNVTKLLLEEVGLDRLTTVLIAERAGMSVGTLYEYFPNKHAVIYALAKRWVDQMEQLTIDYEAEEGKYVNWAAWYTEYAGAMTRLYSQEKGLVKYYDMLVSVVELRTLDDKLDEIIVGYLTRSLRALLPDLNEDGLPVLIRSIITIMHNMLSRAVNLPQPLQNTMLRHLDFVVHSLILKEAY